jgi:hypothetical protein
VDAQLGDLGHRVRNGLDPIPRGCPADRPGRRGLDGLQPGLGSEVGDPRERSIGPLRRANGWCSWAP